MIAAEMLASWRWSGELAGVLQCTYRVVSAPEVMRASPRSFDAGARFMPSSTSWDDEPWLEVEVRLTRNTGDRLGLMQALYAPQSAKLEPLARALVDAARALVLADVEKVLMTSGSAFTPAESFFGDDMRWIGP